MRTSKGLTLVGVVLVLAFSAQGNAAPRKASQTTTTTGTYTVGSQTVPGVDTGVVLQNGQSVTVTATGIVCPNYQSLCVGPDGNGSLDTTQSSSYGANLLPGAPAWGLVGRVGDGPWMQVGSGPTKLSGSGDVVFAVNDSLFGDNSGSFVVTLSSSGGGCYPGNGYGDKNHDHSGPPGRTPDACYPGNGYGDTNHDHSGPPGQTNAVSSGAKGKGHNR